MPTIKVDGQEINAKPGDNLLQVLLNQGIDIPYFCWHPSLGSIGACRQCAVLQFANAEDERGRIVMACMTPVSEGALFSVQGSNAAQFRQSVIENLMLNHPHDCPVCEEGGECHLQDMTVLVGHHNRAYKGLKTTFRNQYLGPFINHEMNRCITCYRCVRFYRDYAGGHDLSAFASRDRVFFGRAQEGFLENEFSGNLVEVCPTGVFTDKSLSKHYTRKWDLQSAPSVCVSCSLGCNTYASEHSGQLRRIHNRYHSEVNGYFLCDRGRFGADFVNSNQRIKQAGIRNAQGLYDAVSMATATIQVEKLLASCQHVVGIGSPRASLEANFALKQLVGDANYCTGMSAKDQSIHQVIVEVLDSKLNTPSLVETQTYDAILILGEDVTNHAPRLALSLRQAGTNIADELAEKAQIPLWHDAAVREIAQHQRCPLIVLTPLADRLDEVASTTARLNPLQISQVAMAVSAKLNAEKYQLPDGLERICDEIVATLITAKKPLIVSGASLQSLMVVQAAANLAIALSATNPSAGIFLCANECNSVGVSLLGQTAGIEAQLADKPDLLIVLENDLSHRLGINFSSLLKNVNAIVAIDHLDNATTSLCHIALPAATFAEAEATLINSEGRAQRSLAVFNPAAEVTASYRLLDNLAKKVRSLSQLRQQLVEFYPAAQGIIAAAPGAEFSIAGSKVPRMSHRASGRTAVLANLSVHEPQQPVDSESALAFSMEGNHQQAPSSLRAFTWAPGWNSNQSIQKFQHDGGGKKSGPGVLLLTSGHDLQTYDVEFEDSKNFLGQQHIFGSDEVSCYAQELSERVPLPYLKINPDTAKKLHLEINDGVACLVAQVELQLQVIIDEAVADDCYVYPLLNTTRCLLGVDEPALKRIENWTPRPQVITSDRSS